MDKQGKKTRKYRHLLIDEELYKKLWEIVKRRFDVPVKKFHIVVNEALREYIQKHYPELLGGE